MYEGEVTELTPVETENPGGGYGKVRLSCNSFCCLFCTLPLVGDECKNPRAAATGGCGRAALAFGRRRMAVGLRGDRQCNCKPCTGCPGA